VEGLLVQLLDQLAQTPSPPTTPLASNPTHEVVLDLYLEGARYTLTRVHPPADHNRVNLSPREKEIIRLVCAGLPNKGISDVLEISPWTVGTYLKRIFAKLGVCSRAEMVARTLRDDLLGRNQYAESEGWLTLLPGQ
jgi:DNA-binding CsgD family transcriptional regulator